MRLKTNLINSFVPKIFLNPDEINRLNPCPIRRSACVNSKTVSSKVDTIQKLREKAISSDQECLKNKIKIKNMTKQKKNTKSNKYTCKANKVLLQH